MHTLDSMLNAFINNEKSGSSSFINYTPDAIRRLLKYYGNPHRKFKTVHIAGTNGKGSVAYMLQSIMMTAGYSTGLYTSPHLVKVTERIRIDRRNITNADLLKYIDDLTALAAVKKIFPTWFDALTIAAFRYFYDKHVDIAIIETGLGGRLDSTNVISPLVSIITSVSRDHMNVLGRSIHAIAAEKAGIIKPGTSLISAAANRAARDVISARALECGSPVYLAGRDIRIQNIRISGEDSLMFDMDFMGTRLKSIGLGTVCRFQAVNASCAAACSILLRKGGFELPGKYIRRGLAAARVPGRFSLLLKKPPVLFDPAHNPSAFKSLIEAVRERFPGKKYVAVVSFMKDKDYPAMLRMIRQHLTTRVFYYELPDERCVRPPLKHPLEKTDIFYDVKSFGETHSLADALIKDITDSTVIIAAGSFRLFPAIKKTVLLINKYYS